MNSLKRHEALQPLSRDHVVGLHQAQILKKASLSSVQDQDRAVMDFATVWREDLVPHFADEERILPRFIRCDALCNQMLDDHSKINFLVSKILNCEEIQCSDLLHLAELLEAHIRWEEHELFPAIENVLSNAQLLSELGEQTNLVEESRKRKSGRFARRKY